MPCLLVVLALLIPRVVMFFIWLLTDWFARAFAGGALIPLLGFFFLPYATLAYMAAQLNGGVTGWWLVVLVIAIIVDLGHWSSGAGVKRRRA
jgi:hypothetical protein